MRLPSWLPWSLVRGTADGNQANVANLTFGRFFVFFILRTRLIDSAGTLLDKEYRNLRRAQSNKLLSNGIDANPDPYFFGPTGSVSPRHGSGSFHHQVKK